MRLAILDAAEPTYCPAYLSAQCEAQLAGASLGDHLLLLASAAIVFRSNGIFARLFFKMPRLSRPLRSRADKLTKRPNNYRQ